MTCIKDYKVGDEIWYFLFPMDGIGSLNDVKLIHDTVTSVETDYILTSEGIAFSLWENIDLFHSRTNAVANIMMKAASFIAKLPDEIEVHND